MSLLLYIGDATVSLIHNIFSTYGDYRTVAPLFVTVVVCGSAAPPIVVCTIYIYIYTPVVLHTVIDEGNHAGCLVSISTDGVG